MVPGQSAAFGGSSLARIALGFAAAFADGDRIVSHRAALADVSAARYLDFVAGPVRQAGIFPEGVFAVSEMACPGSDSGGMGVRRHDGPADRTEAAGLHPAADAIRQPPEVWRRSPRPRRDRARNPDFRSDCAGHDDLSVVGGGRDPAWPRCRLAG